MLVLLFSYVYPSPSGFWVLSGRLSLYSKIKQSRNEVVPVTNDKKENEDLCVHKRCCISVLLMKYIYIVLYDGN